MDRLTQVVAPRIQQKQSLILTNKMQLSLKVASLPLLELREEVLQALEENIALEWEGDRDEKALTSSGNKEELQNSIGRSKARTSSTSIEDFIENIPDNQRTLKDDLLFQVGFAKEDEKVIETARTIIQNLDSKGFNIVPIRDLVEWSEKDGSYILQDDLLRRSLRIVHFLEPQGCACDSIKDYLLFQLYMKCKSRKHLPQEKSVIHLAVRLIAKHFSLIKEANYAKVKSILAKNGHPSYTLQQIKEAISLIGELKPYPAYRYSDDEVATYITPDAFVKSEKDELVIIPNHYALPRIRIAKEIEELSKEKSEAGRFAKKNVQQARDLISSIEERENTLTKVITSIIVFQRDFFYYGVKYLSPLRQKDIADELKLSASTISRIVSNKYLACKWGIFPISYFFSNKAVSNKADSTSLVQSNYVASGYSKQACKEIIRNISEANPKISDSKIAELLEKKGIKLARRTITKYRNEMGIKGVHKR